MEARTLPPLMRRRALLDLDADLAEAIAPEQRAYARRALTVPVLSLEPGLWDAHGVAKSAGAFAVMLTSGLAIRDVLIGSGPASELLGPGDIVDVGTAQEGMLPTAVRLSVAEPVIAAILDERILAAIRAWPALGGVLITRLARQEARQATHRAISQLPRVEQRVVALLWHLAERWGRVTPDGVAVPLTLTHEAIGRLVGARRPTISLALKELSTSGAVTRREDGAWLLDRASARALAPDEDAWRRPEVALVRGSVHTPRRISAAVQAEFEHLRLRVRLLEQLQAARAEHTRDLMERCRRTRAAIMTARAARAGSALALSRPR